MRIINHIAHCARSRVIRIASFMRHGLTYGVRSSICEIDPISGVHPLFVRVIYKEDLQDIQCGIVSWNFLVFWLYID